MHRRFTVDEARALVTELLPVVDRFVALRAELTEAAAAGRSRSGESSGAGRVALADLKAMEASLGEMLDDLRARGLEVKGWAPLLLDFPSEIDGREVLLCWLEGERELRWYHDAALGFPARRPLP